MVGRSKTIVFSLVILQATSSLACSKDIWNLRDYLMEPEKYTIQDSADEKCDVKSADCHDLLVTRVNKMLATLSMHCCSKKVEGMKNLVFLCTPMLYVVNDTIPLGKVTDKPKCADCCQHEIFDVGGFTFKGYFCHCLDQVWDIGLLST